MKQRPTHFKPRQQGVFDEEEGSSKPESEGACSIAGGNDPQKKEEDENEDGKQDEELNSDTADEIDLSRLDVHPYVPCNGCKITHIIGVRWKCAECGPPEYNLCDKCHSRGVWADGHKFGHRVIRLETPQCKLIPSFNPLILRSTLSSSQRRSQ
jgi:hypothetical protein